MALRTILIKKVKSKSKNLSLKCNNQNNNLIQDNKKILLQTWNNYKMRVKIKKLLINLEKPHWIWKRMNLFNLDMMIWNWMHKIMKSLKNQFIHIKHQQFLMKKRFLSCILSTYLIKIMQVMIAFLNKTWSIIIRMILLIIVKVLV